MFLTFHHWSCRQVLDAEANTLAGYKSEWTFVCIMTPYNMSNIKCISYISNMNSKFRLENMK